MDRPSHRKTRQSNDSLKKVPLTKYYRSGADKDGKSPFESRQTGGRSFISKFLVVSLDTTIIVVVIIGLLYSLIVKPSPAVMANSTAFRGNQEYELAAEQQLKSIENTNKITLNEQKIITNLQSKYPEIENGFIELPLFSQTPKLHLDISTPSFYLQSKGVTIVVDSQGTAVGDANSFSNIKSLPTIIDKSDFVVSKGKAAFSSSAVGFINDIIYQSRLAKVPIESLTISNSPQEIDLRTKDKPYYIKFYLDGDAKLQIGQFLAARHHFKTNNIHPSKYLDVRVKGKIFYQ